jgi:hypothetical protein
VEAVEVLDILVLYWREVLERSVKEILAVVQTRVRLIHIRVVEVVLVLWVLPQTVKEA